MAIEKFPPVEFADENGLLAIGGDLEVASLLLAYKNGIFPWPVFEDDVLSWFCPPERAVLFFNELHISRSLKRELKRTSLDFHFDEEFVAVIDECAESTNREGQLGTWITGQIRKAYMDFHLAGYCHSLGAFSQGRLVGGLYGVTIGEMFAGESLFYLEPNASKLCLAALIAHLGNKGARWIDCQQMTPLLESFGAREIPREEYLDLLSPAVKKDISLIEPSDVIPKNLDVLQILEELQKGDGE